MAKRGRPIQGAQLVGDREGSRPAGQRLKIILQTLGGSMGIEEACGALGIKRSAFHKLRRQFLAGACGLLEPKPRGRKRHEPSAAEIELTGLRQEVAQLKLDLKAQQIREEIALLMPHLLKHKPPRKKGARGVARNVTPTTSRRSEKS